jgi:hypothetical protein
LGKTCEIQLGKGEKIKKCLHTTGGLPQTTARPVRAAVNSPQLRKATRPLTASKQAGNEMQKKYGEKNDYNLQLFIIIIRHTIKTTIKSI